MWVKVYFSSFNLLLWNFLLRFLDEEFGERFLLGGLLCLFCLLLLFGLFFIRCFRECCYSYPIFFLIIFHTVLVFVLMFIFDVKFFQVSHFDSLIVLCALALQFLKNSRFSFVGFVLNFLSAAQHALTTFLHLLLYQALLDFGWVDDFSIHSSAIVGSVFVKYVLRSS